MRIAIIGTGIAGLTATHLLDPLHEVTVYEQDIRPGGHTNTVHVDLGTESCDVDTGFLVFNERNYPGLVRFFDRLGIASHPSDMSFSVADERTGLEWRGTSFSTVFAQRRNLFDRRFVGMLTDVARFNRAGRPVARGEVELDLRTTLGEWLSTQSYSEAFFRSYLTPLAASIWSADPSDVLGMPAATTLRFFERHGLLGFGDQPAWRTVTGGAKRYVDAVLEPVAAAGRLRLADPVHSVRREDGSRAAAGATEVVVESARSGPQGERYDHVVIATHSDQALKFLERPSIVEQELLGAITYQANRATLHSDTSVMPRTRRAWASWNYHCLAEPQPVATLTYHLNRLQGLEVSTDLMVTLNRDEVIDEASVIARFDYAHPVLSPGAVAAQRRHHELIGHDGLSYAGAYWGYGFHEDGLQSALRVCEHLGATL